MGDRDIPKEIPVTKPDDNIVAKVAQENIGKIGGPQGADKIVPGADIKVGSLPKVDVGKVAGAAALAETVKQITPDFRNPQQVAESGKVLETKVASAVEQANKGDRKPAENLSNAIDQSTKATVAHVDNLNKQVNSVQSAMDAVRTGKIDTNMA